MEDATLVKICCSTEVSRNPATETGTGRVGTSVHGSQNRSLLDGRCQSRPERGQKSYPVSDFQIKIMNALR